MISKVYAVGYNEYEGDTIVAVFTEKKDAERFLDFLGNRFMEIMEYPLNPKFSEVPYYIIIDNGKIRTATKWAYGIGKEEQIKKEKNTYYALIYADTCLEAIKKAKKMIKEIWGDDL